MTCASDSLIYPLVAHPAFQEEVILGVLKRLRTSFGTSRRWTRQVAANLQRVTAGRLSTSVTMQSRETSARIIPRHMFVQHVGLVQQHLANQSARRHSICLAYLIGLVSASRCVVLLEDQH